MYEKFKHPSENNNGLYAWILVPSYMLDIATDKDARNAKKNIEYDDEGNELSYDFKTMREYLSVWYISNDESLCLALLNESLSPRQYGVTAEDLDFWNEKLQAYGIIFDNWLTIAEAKELMQSPEWASETT